MPHPNLIQQKLNAKANNLRQVDFIYQEIAKRMTERLNYIKLTPHQILDIGSGLNLDADLLKQKYPKSSLYKVDFAINLLKKSKSTSRVMDRLFKLNSELICADALNLPILSQSMDLVWSDLVLPYITDLNGYFKEIRRVLKLGGSFLVTGLGVDSLWQLREVGLNTYNFPDMHIIGDILVRLGFSNPVTDIEYITLEYDNFRQLLADIRLIGCGALSQKNSYLTKSDYIHLEQSFAKLIQKDKLPLTLEIFYAHAWKDKIELDLPQDTKLVQFHKSGN